MTLSDSWFGWLLGVVVTAGGWFRKRLRGRIETLERDMFRRLSVDGTFHAAADSRIAVVERAILDTGGRLDRIELKLDRLLERQ